MIFAKNSRIHMPEFDANNWEWSSDVAESKSQYDLHEHMTHWTWLPAFLRMPDEKYDVLSAVMPSFAFSLPHDPAGNLLPAPRDYVELLDYPVLPRNMTEDEIKKRQIAVMFEHRVITYRKGWDRFRYG